jgi:TolB protein
MLRSGLQSALAIICAVFLTHCSDTSAPPPGDIPIKPVYPYIDQFPSFTPDGTKVLYTHSGITEVDSSGGYNVDPDQKGLWLADTSGADASPLLTGGGYHGEYSPGGSRIVFAAGQIYTAQVIADSVDEGSIRQLTTEGNNFLPAWSPDGLAIAYDSNADNVDGSYRVWVMSFDGTDKRILTDGVGGSIRMADWFPDGVRLVFSAYTAGTHYKELFTVRADGSDIQRLTDTEVSESHPKVSPDGGKIVYDRGSEVWIMNSDGTGQTRLTKGIHPNWSPDGGRIVFIYSPPDDFRQKGTVWAMDSEGRNLRQLTFGPE